MPSDKAANWEANHTRVTFHCPVVTVEALNDASRQSGQSKSSLIVEALKQAGFPVPEKPDK